MVVLKKKKVLYLLGKMLRDIIHALISFQLYSLVLIPCLKWHTRLHEGLVGVQPR